MLENHMVIDTPTYSNPRNLIEVDLDSFADLVEFLGDDYSDCYAEGIGADAHSSIESWERHVKSIANALLQGNHEKAHQIQFHKLHEYLKGIVTSRADHIDNIVLIENGRRYD